MEKQELRINVYDGEPMRGQVVARVRYNQDLDYWTGSNFSNGGTGMHKGITKLQDGRYVIIIGSQWQGAKDYGCIVSAEEALQEILESGNSDLLDSKRFAELKELHENSLIKEEPQ